MTVLGERLMPYVETPADLASWLADQIGVWNAPERCEWETEVVERMRAAVANEKRLTEIIDGQREINRKLLEGDSG